MLKYMITALIAFITGAGIATLMTASYFIKKDMEELMRPRNENKKLRHEWDEFHKEFMAKWEEKNGQTRRNHNANYGRI